MNHFTVTLIVAACLTTIAAIVTFVPMFVLGMWILQ